MITPTHDTQILNKDVRWGEFRVGDLFEIQTGSLLNQSDLIEGKTPRISTKSTENGIVGYYDTTNLRSVRHAENFISVNFFGADGGVFYHPYKASVEMKVHILKIPNLEFTRLTALFVVTALKSGLRGFDYGSQLSSSKLKDGEYYIKLPILDEKPDFEYMEAFIFQIENEYITNLESKRNLYLNAYLTVAECDSYELNDNDKKVLELKPKWSEFKIKDLFDNIRQGSRLKKLDQVEGELPFIMAGTTNRGLVKYIGNQKVRRFPQNSITIDIFGNVFYRSFEYGAGDDIGVYWNEGSILSRETMLYYCTVIEAALRGKYSYGKKLRSSQSHEITVKLPIISEGLPDFEYMETFIKALQKCIIADIISKFDFENITAN